MSSITEFFDPMELKNQLLRERAQQAKVEQSRQFVAHENELAYLSFDNRSDINTGVLYEIFVLPQYRSHGLGTALVSCAEGIALTIGCGRVRVSPRAFDASVNQHWLETWYSKQGYSVSNDGSTEFEKSLKSDKAQTP